MTDGAAMPLHSSAMALPNLDRIIRGLLLVFIFSLPFKGLLFLERNGFIILLILLGIWCVAHRRHFFIRTPLDLPLVVFVSWVALTIPFATYPVYSLKEFGKLLQQGLIFYTVVFFFRDRTHWIRLVWLLVGTLVVVASNGLVRFEETTTGHGSFLTAEVWLTTYLIMMLPVCFALAWLDDRPWARGFFAVGAAVAVSCLFLTQSRAGLLAFLVELWAFAMLLKRRAMLITAAAVTVMLVAAVLLLVKVTTTADGEMTIVPRVSVPIKTSTFSFVHRLDIWTFALKRIAEHPLAGIGYGKETSKMLFGQVPEDNVPPGHAPVRKHGTHNILLEVALLVGIPGMLLFVWLAVRLARTLFKSYRLAEDAQARAVLLGVGVGVIGLAVRLQFDQMLVGTLAIQFWVLTGIAIAAAEPYRAMGMASSQAAEIHPIDELRSSPNLSSG